MFGLARFKSVSRLYAAKQKHQLGCQIYTHDIDAEQQCSTDSVIVIIPMVTAGGIRATATIMPTSMLEALVTSDKEAAAPEARAIAVPE